MRLQILTPLSELAVSLLTDRRSSSFSALPPRLLSEGLVQLELIMNSSKSLQLDHFLAGWIGGERSRVSIVLLIMVRVRGFLLLFKKTSPPIERAVWISAAGGAVAAAESRSVCCRSGGIPMQLLHPWLVLAHAGGVGA